MAHGGKIRTNWQKQLAASISSYSRGHLLLCLRVNENYVPVWIPCTINCQFCCGERQTQYTENPSLSLVSSGYKLDLSNYFRYLTPFYFTPFLRESILIPGQSPLGINSFLLSFCCPKCAMASCPQNGPCCGPFFNSCRPCTCCWRCSSCYGVCGPCGPCGPYGRCGSFQGPMQNIAIDPTPVTGLPAPKFGTCLLNQIPKIPS